MLRPYCPGDLDTLLCIWLEGNLDAHPFAPAAYWEGNLALVRGLLPQAELLVAEENGKATGFLGLDGNYIAGIFVDRAARSQGIGHCLITAAKERRPCLTLRVYEKNTRAQAFYRREGFTQTAAGTDPDTGEPELTLTWCAERQKGTP